MQHTQHPAAGAFLARHSDWITCEICRQSVRFSAQGTWGRQTFLKYGQCMLCWGNDWYTWRGRELGAVTDMGLEEMQEADEETVSQPDLHAAVQEYEQEDDLEMEQTEYADDETAEWQGYNEE